MTISRIAIDSREQWLALRAQDITASDVPAVCGEGLFGSPAKVWAEKRGMIGAAEMTEAMKRGLWGEAAVFEAIKWEFPEWEQRRAKVYLRDADARLGATPDGFAIDPQRPGVGVIQAKVISESVFRSQWLHDAADNPHDVMAPASPPLAYVLQTLTEGMLGSTDWCRIAVLVVGAFRWTLRMFDVERHADAELRIRDKVGAFWRDYLDPGIEPPIDPTRDEDLVKQLYPRDDGTAVDLTGSNRAVELVDRLAVVKAQLKTGESDKTAIETEIKAMLGAHTYGHMGDGRLISWKAQTRKAYSVAETTFRVLRVGKGA